MDPNVKHLIDKIKNDLSKSLENYVFEPNDCITQKAVTDNITKYLTNTPYDFKVVCDESNNPPYVIKELESLVQNLPEEILENYLIESDENESRLFYHDILYRTLDKKNNKIISYFEEKDLSLIFDSNTLQASLYIKPVQTIDHIVLNFKITP